MKACVLVSPAPRRVQSLAHRELPKPKPAAGQVLGAGACCGVCRTRPPRGRGRTASEEIAGGAGPTRWWGVVEENGAHASRFQPGARVGIPWLHQTDGVCRILPLRARETSASAPCSPAGMVDGGYAEYVVAPRISSTRCRRARATCMWRRCLCAGIIGFRTLRLSGVEPGGRLAMYGFGAAAHVAIQVAPLLGTSASRHVPRPAPSEAGARSGRCMGRGFGRRATRKRSTPP